MEIIDNGGSFLEGFEDGALSGAISGAIGGAAFAGLGQLGASPQKYKIKEIHQKRLRS